MTQPRSVEFATASVAESSPLPSGAPNRHRPNDFAIAAGGW